MTRRICAIVLSLLLLSAMSAMAQQPEQRPEGGPRPGGPGRGPQMTVDELVARLSSDLSLTDDQKPKIKAILESQREKQKALREDTSTPMEEKRPKMREIQESTQTQIKAVLTPEQQKKYEEMQAKMRERREHGPGGPPPEGQKPPPPQ